MNVNIVTVNSGWILQKLSERMTTGNTNPNVNFKVSNTVDLSADVNYYVDLQNCYFGQKSKCDIAYFTHADRNSGLWLTTLLRERNSQNLDGIVSMNERYTEMLRTFGWDKPLVTIVPGEPSQFFKFKKIKIGIVSRGGFPGYGQHFIEKLFETHQDLKDTFEFHFLGNGWENLDKYKGQISVYYYTDSDYSFYQEFYNKIDYLLIPGLWTAGPISMQEALYCGIPVIGANVGFVGYEFKADYMFTPNNVKELHDILNKILEPRLLRMDQVKDLSWSGYDLQLINFFESVLNEKNKLSN